MPVHLKRQTQIKEKAQKKAQVGSLLFNIALTKVPTKYFNYNDVFLAKKRSRTFKEFRNK